MIPNTGYIASGQLTHIIPEVIAMVGGKNLFKIAGTTLVVLVLLCSVLMVVGPVSAGSRNQYFTVTSPVEHYNVTVDSTATFMVDVDFLTNDTVTIDHYIWNFDIVEPVTSFWNDFNTTANNLEVHFGEETADHTFFVNVTATSSGHGQASDTFYVYVGSAPDPDPHPNNTVPELTVYHNLVRNRTYSFTCVGTDADGDPLTYTSTVHHETEGILYTFTSQDFEVTLPHAGVYEITTVCSDGKDEVTYSITMDIAPEGGEEISHDPVVIMHISDPKPEIGQEVEFDASDSYDPDGDEITFEWVLADGANYYVEEFVHAFAEQGSYMITLRVSDGNHTTQLVKVIEVVPVGQGKNVAPFARIVTDHYWTMPDTVVQLTAINSSDPDNDPLTYDWLAYDQTGDVADIQFNEYDAWFIPREIGVYTVTVIVADWEYTDHASVTIHATEDGKPPEFDNGTKPDDNGTTNQTDPGDGILDVDFNVHWTINNLSVSMFIGFINESGNYTLDAIDATYMITWTFDDGHMAHGVAIVHAFEKYGVHMVIVDVMDLQGNVAVQHYTFLLHESQDNPFNETIDNHVVAMIDYTADGYSQSLTYDPLYTVIKRKAENGYLELTVYSEDYKGNLFIITVDPSTIGTTFMSEVDILVNGDLVEKRALPSVVDYTGTHARYAISNHSGEFQIVLYIPDGNDTTIVVQKEAEASEEDDTLNSWQIAILILVGGLLFLTATALVVLMVMKKKKPDYYDDYKTAGEEGDPDIKSKPEKNSFEDWDDFNN